MANEPMLLQEIPHSHIKSVHIDWLSYTILDTPPLDVRQTAISHSERFFCSAFGDEIYDSWFVNGDWKDGKNHHPYASAIANEHGIVFHYGRVPHQKIEIQGQACQQLAAMGKMLNVVREVWETITRLEIAIDIDGSCGASVDAIASMAKSKRFKARSELVSNDGHSKYIGSWHSDRYVKVYEYAEGHPSGRHGTPRIEFKLKKKHAREYCKWLFAYGINEATQMLLNVYEFQGIKIGNMKEKMPAPSSERTTDKTVSWLVNQVAPAFLRLCREGVIRNPQEFLIEHFMPREELHHMTLFEEEGDE